jgi:hypothetical protein
MSIEKDKFEDEEDFQMIYIPMMLTLQGVKPPLEKSPIKNVLIIDEWLNEIVMAELNPIRRKDIILSAANQDGGAHVDDNPNMNTKILRRGIGTFTITIDGKKKTEILSNHHFPLIRQFAYEVLHSKELTSLIQN